MSKHHHFSTPEFTALRARAKDKRDKGVAMNTEYQASQRGSACVYFATWRNVSAFTPAAVISKRMLPCSAV